MKMHKLSSAIALSIPFNLFAFTPLVEIHGGGGISSLDMSDGSIVVTSSERDTLQSSNDDWDAGTGMLGIGMSFPLMNNANNFVNTGRLELNGYHTSDTLRGKVFRFGDPAFADYKYRMSVRSTRLMVDAVLNAANFNRTSVFLKGGIGESWNRVRYRDLALHGDECGPNTTNTISTSNRTRSRFAAEGGAGVQYNFNNQLGLSLEYLYTHIGKVRSGRAVGTGCLTSVSPVRFDFNIQSALLALHYTFA